MRNSGLFGPFLAFTILTSLAGAQENNAVIKADTKASQASQHQAKITPPSDDTSQATAPVISIPRQENIFTSDESVVVAKWDGSELTNLEINAILENRRPANLRTLSSEQFARLTKKQQTDAIKLLAWEQILLQDAQKAGIDKDTPAVAEVVEAQKETLLNRLYYQEKIMPRLDELTAENAKEYYDEHKDKMFTQPAYTTVRALHIGTYEMVTAEEGDTLSGLATAISGDADAAGRILQGTTPYYLRQTPTELEDKVLSSPLQGGEVLFIPRNDEAVSSATKLAKSLRKRIINGESIDEIATETNPDDFPVTATQPVQVNSRAGYWNEILDAASSLGENTTVSEIVKTPGGVDIIVLEDRQTTEVVPFENVKEQLVEQAAKDKTEQRGAIEETRDEILKKLWEKYNVTINDEAISRPSYQQPEPLSTNTVIAQTDDFKYTLDRFQRALRMTGKDWGQLTKQERLDVLHIAPEITNYLIAKEARALGFDKNEEFQKQIEGITKSQIVAVYKKQIDNPEDRRVTDAELRTYYNDHIDKYTSAAQVTIRELSKRINMTLPPATKAEDIEKAKKSLTEIRSRINNEEDFSQLARRESEAISTRSRGGLVGTVPDDFRGEAFKNQLRQLKVGDISEPFLYGSEVMIVRLDDRLAPTVQPFEEVTRRVMHDYAANMPQKLKNQEMETALEEVNFEITY